LIGIHFFTGLSAFGLISDKLFNDFSVWSNTFFAFIFLMIHPTRKVFS